VELAESAREDRSRRGVVDGFRGGLPTEAAGEEGIPKQPVETLSERAHCVRGEASE
jgi:hypothetical protein